MRGPDERVGLHGDQPRRVIQSDRQGAGSGGVPTAQLQHRVLGLHQLLQGTPGRRGGGGGVSHEVGVVHGRVVTQVRGVDRGGHGGVVDCVVVHGGVVYGGVVQFKRIRKTLTISLNT